MAFDNLSSFDAALSGEGDRLGAQTLLVHKKVTMEAFGQLIRTSPVDTGRFRANWNCAVGIPDTSTREATSSGGEIEALGKLGALKPYGITYLDNALPYAEALENGSSRQAPAGMLTPMVARLGLDVLEVSP